MVRAIRQATVERGHDPRDFSLIAFGGSGGLHASAVAKEIGMTRVIVPPLPGNFSALGILMAQMRHEYVSMVVSRLTAITAEEVENRLAALAQAACAQMAAEGFAGPLLQATADVRYSGQQYELNVPIDLKVTDVGEVVRVFAQQHIRLYGYELPDVDVELVALRITALGNFSIPDITAGIGTGGTSAAGQNQPVAQRPVCFDAKTEPILCPVYSRQNLTSSISETGPAVIEESGATTLVLPGDRWYMDESGNIAINW